MITAKKVHSNKRALPPKHGFKPPVARGYHLKPGASRPHSSKKERLDALIQHINDAIEPVNDYFASERLSKEDQSFIISVLHTLNILRDKLEMMKNPLTKEELAMVSEHLFRKAQSAFSD